MQVVIYKQDNNVVVLTPSPECLQNHSLMEIAIKDVPFNKPFKIVDISELPQDIPQEAWEVDDTDLDDGVGGETNEFN